MDKTLNINIIIASAFVRHNCEGVKDSHSTQESIAMWNAFFLGVTLWWLHMTRDVGNTFALLPRHTYSKHKAHKEIILKPVC